MIKISFSKSCKREILYKQIFKEINDLVLDSIQIVSILSFFIGGVVSIQMALSLENPLLSKTLIGYATRESVILEFAPTFISIIMAGKVGSYITSSIGTMRVTEQIDALEVMGINSLNYLVFPKIIAMLLYPFVITISMFLGIVGGLLAISLTGVPSEAYIQGIQMDFESYHVTYSYIKTLVFSFVLATVPSFHGYYMKGGALDVGKASTQSFYWTSIIIIILNYIITQLLLA
tara:strand:- start:193 stop:891 length:699 start_codon:yes stop_codon:yes gene_type:complete